MTTHFNNGVGISIGYVTPWILVLMLPIMLYVSMVGLENYLICKWLILISLQDFGLDNIDGIYVLEFIYHDQ
jgi:hypothetical protein